MKPFKFRVLYRNELTPCEFYLLSSDGRLYDTLGAECREPEYRIQLFTGAVDKNGLDIYEGDLLSICCKWDNGEQEEHDNALVIWNKEFLQFEITTDKMNISLSAFYNYELLVVGYKAV